MAAALKTICITKSPEETKKMGTLLAHAVLDSGCLKQALVLALRGDLGAGKTQFVQGFARGLGISGTVASPTFVILKRYPVAKKYFKTFCHIDCYRLDSGKDLEALGIAGILADPGGIVAIEWPDAARDYLRRIFLSIDFEIIGESERRVTVEIQNIKSKK